MEPFKSILVDVDATASAHPALERGVLLAQACGASLTVVDVVTVPSHARHYLPSALEENLAREQRRQLERVAESVKDVRVETKLLVGRPATVLIQEVLRSNHDLLMRSHARDLTASGSQPFGAVDMELLRKCPCTALLARHGRAAVPPVIAAAVNASDEGIEAQELNAKILETSSLIASRLRAAPPRLLQAWVPYAERMIRSHAADDQFGSYVESARQRAESDLSKLVQSSDAWLPGVQPTLRRGAPEDVIPEFVVAEGIDLLVMGTVARGGLVGVLLGNTAERILRKLPCSVLAVKPDGFVSPVRLDAS